MLYTLLWLLKTHFALSITTSNVVHISFVLVCVSKSIWHSLLRYGFYFDSPATATSACAAISTTLASLDQHKPPPPPRPSYLATPAASTATAGCGRVLSSWRIYHQCIWCVVPAGSRPAMLPLRETCICYLGVFGKALLFLLFSLWCKVNLEDPCHHFGILRRVSDFFRNVYTIFLSVLWTLMKKQQDQHRLSSVLVIFRYLNGIQRANRSMNACDNIMSGRKREVATINPTGNFDLFLTDCYSCREPHASRRNVFEKHGNRSASQRSKHIAFWQLVGSPECVQGSRLFLRSSPKINWEHWCVGSIYSGQCYWIHWSGAICYEIKKVV